MIVSCLKILDSIIKEDIPTIIEIQRVLVLVGNKLKEKDIFTSIW